MPYGRPRTEEERRIRHKMIYGEDSEPPKERRGRGMYYQNMSFQQCVKEARTYEEAVEMCLGMNYDWGEEQLRAIEKEFEKGKRDRYLDFGYIQEKIDRLQKFLKDIEKVFPEYPKVERD